MWFTGSLFLPTARSLFPFRLRCFHHLAFCLKPMVLVITMPAAALKPDVVCTLLNHLAQDRIKVVTVVLTYMCTCVHLAQHSSGPSMLRNLLY
jgi:ABC-type histidine transport system ATPase subunit